MNIAGIDFGTTNSSVALATGDSQVELASFRFAGAETLSSRSVLYFEQSKSTGGMKRTHGLSGPAAIERYLESDEKGRLIQSLKSHLSSRGTHRDRSFWPPPQAGGTDLADDQ